VVTADGVAARQRVLDGQQPSRVRRLTLRAGEAARAGARRSSHVGEAEGGAQEEADVPAQEARQRRPVLEEQRTAAGEAQPLRSGNGEEPSGPSALSLELREESIARRHHHRRREPVL
jgi:hypothetical protein